MIPEYPSAPVHPPDFKDRRTGLIVFGILSCLLGGIAGLGALVMPLALTISRFSPAAPPPELRSLISAALLYLFAAVLFIWVGVDSFRTKRWVRPIVITIGWTWLILGVCGMVMLAFTVPHMVQMMNTGAAAQGGKPLPSAFATVMVIVVVVVSALIYLGLPIAYLLFYSGKNVRATLEHFDPTPSWTERVPMQVLGLSVGLALAAAATLMSMTYAVLPIFGVILHGLPAVVAFLVIATLFAWAALLSYQRKMIGWWMTTVLTLVLPASIIVSLRRHTLAELYANAGFPPETIQMMKVYSASGNLPWIVALAVLTLACMGYMVYVLKYFRQTDTPTVPFAARAVE